MGSNALRRWALHHSRSGSTASRKGWRGRCLSTVGRKGAAWKSATATTLTALAASIAALHNGDAANVQRISPRAVSLDYFWRTLAGGLTPTARWLDEVACPHLAGLLRTLAASAAAIIAAASPLWQDATPAPVHGDLRLAHALLQDRRALLLDWEMFGLGDPALDVATFLFHEAGRAG
jgi:aminoglycoside phosphotransferase (APT) family kinase protein